MPVRVWYSCCYRVVIVIAVIVVIVVAVAQSKWPVSELYSTNSNFFAPFQWSDVCIQCAHPSVLLYFNLLTKFKSSKFITLLTVNFVMSSTEWFFSSNHYIQSQVVKLYDVFSMIEAFVILVILQQYFCFINWNFFVLFISLDMRHSRNRW